MPEIRNSPRAIMSAPRMFVLVIAIVFVAEAGVMILLPLFLPETVDERVQAIVDSCVLTVISAPILWFAIFEPSRRWEREAIRAEHLHTVAQLATGVAHEVRNPLTSIKLLAQTHLRTAESPALREDLNIIVEEIRRMESSLNSFLDYARPRPPQRTYLDLSQVVRRMLLLLEGRITKQHVQVEFETPQQPLYIYADPEQIRCVLLNLSLNALDMMPHGGTLSIEIECCRVDRVCVHVDDTGPGIAPEHKAHLFEPFFTTRETGVGLGLVISRRIARDHGGDLVFENRPEGGARFSLRLPSATPT